MWPMLVKVCVVAPTVHVTGGVILWPLTAAPAMRIRFEFAPTVIVNENEVHGALLLLTSGQGAAALLSMAMSLTSPRAETTKTNGAIRAIALEETTFLMRHHSRPA